MAKSYNIHEPFEFRGEFFLPNSEDTISGILKYDPEDEICLDLLGTFHNDIEDWISPKMVECIWGILENGNKVTLFRSAPSTTAQHFVYENYKCTYLLIGEHTTSHSEKAYKKVTISCPMLTNWFNHPVIESNISNDGNIKTSVNKESLSDVFIRHKVDMDRLLEVSTQVTINSSLCPSSVTYTQETVISFVYNSAKSLEDITADVVRICSFLSFVSLSTQEYTSIKIQKDEDSLYLIHIPYVSLPKKFDSGYLVSYKDIEPRLGDYISRWFTEEKLSPIVAHLIDSISYRKVFTENDFLIIAQALDGYSKRFVHIGEKANIRKFEDRIDDMYGKYKDLKIFKSGFPEGSCVARTRNYFSHLYDESTLKGDEILDGKGLMRLTHKLRKLLICYIMEFVGFSKNEIDTLTSNSNSYYLKN